MKVTSNQQEKAVRARRLAATEKAAEGKREVAAEQAAVRAAQAAVPYDRTAAAMARERQAYQVGTYVHRKTGSTISILDTMAPDATRRAIAPDATPEGKQLRYAVQCLDHGAGPEFFGTLKEAERAARNSPAWCADCAQLTVTRPKVRARNKAQARTR